MPKKTLTICYYISGHGYGHAARACQVMAALPANVNLLVRTNVPADFIARESGRKVKVIPGQFDTGVLQTDNRTLDWPATIEKAGEVNAACAGALLDEVALLRKNRVDIVVSDVPPAPLEASRMAGLPSVVIGNFTWVEIYDREKNRHPQAGALADLWREQYALATLAIRTAPAFPMKYFRHKTDVELIARRGKNVRAALCRHLGEPPKQRLVLLYFGTFGDAALTIPEIPGITFVAFTPMPKPVIELNPKEWRFPDVVASVDCVIAKPGYGTIGECMANGTPVVYHPRTEFAEYPLLRKAIESTGAGVAIAGRDLMTGRWQKAIDTACKLKPKRLPARGAQQAAELILDLVE